MASCPGGGEGWNLNTDIDSVGPESSSGHASSVVRDVSPRYVGDALRPDVEIYSSLFL